MARTPPNQSAPVIDVKENHETFSDWRELSGLPMCAPSSDKISICRQLIESVSMESSPFKQTKDGTFLLVFYLFAKMSM
jgi:hypothetical protein